MSGYQIDSGDYGARMTLTGPWSPEATDAARRAAVAEVYLNYALGWKGESVEWVGGMPTLKALQILAPKLTNIDGLRLVPELRRLRLEVSPRAKVDLGCFSNLEEFSGFWANTGSTVFEASRLERLRLIGYAGLEPEGFARLKALARLALYSAKIRSLGDIPMVSTLRSLCLAHCRGLLSLSGLERLGLLEELVVERCKALDGIEPLARLQALKALILEDCGAIKSLAPVRDLQSLQTLRFTGSTRIVDGDLTPLQNLRHLRNVGFVQRKHYNLSWRSLPPQLFDSRYQVAWS